MQQPDQTRMEVKKISFDLKEAKLLSEISTAPCFRKHLIFETFYSNKAIYLNSFQQPTIQFSLLITSVYDKHIIQDFSVYADMSTASLSNSGIASFMPDTHLTHTFVMQLLMQWIKYGNY